MFFLFLLIGVTLLSPPLIQSTFVSQAEWDAYKIAFGKSYLNSPITEAYARYYYAYNKKLISNHNAQYARGLRSYSLKVNQFTDMRSKHFNALFPPTRTTPFQGNISPLPPAPEQPAPATFDPRQDLGLKVTIQDQGTCCNSGWAYASVKSIEILQAFQTGNLRPATLSAQNIIDCAGAGRACKNQIPQTAFDYLTKYEADLHLESDYRNVNTSSEPGMCVPNGSLVTNLRAYSHIPDGDDNTLLIYLADNYPAVIEYNPASFEFMHYDQGVFTPPSHTKNGSHFITVIGYGKDARTNTDYWLAINSFGETWGENGYIRIARKATTPITRSTLLPTELA